MFTVFTIYRTTFRVSARKLKAVYNIYFHLRNVLLPKQFTTTTTTVLDSKRLQLGLSLSPIDDEHKAANGRLIATKGLLYIVINKVACVAGAWK